MTDYTFDPINETVLYATQFNQTSYTNVVYGVRDVLQNCQERALALMFDDYRYMFIASCLAILCGIELGKQIQGYTTFKTFMKQSWTYIVYIFLYVVYGVWSLFHIAGVING